MTLRTSVFAVGFVVILVVSLSAVGLMPASQPATAQAESYVVEQGEQCEVIDSLSGQQTAEELYDYRTHQTHDDYEYSSHGTTQLQESDVSSVFLYEGPGGLSLVIVHDELEGGTAGGAAEFEVIGLPAEGEWTVQDDDYSEGAEGDDVWRHGDVWSDVAWLWEDNRTDGGVFTGLSEEFEVTINPAFNDQQSTYGADEVDGSVDEIHVLSGDLDQPDRLAMASLEEPLVIRSGTCGEPTVQYDRTDQGAPTAVENAAGESVGEAGGGILATIEDTGGEAVALRPPAETGDGVQYDRLSITGSGTDTSSGPEDAVVGMSIEESTPEITGNEDAVPLSALSVDTREGSVDDSALSFSVATATLEEHDATVNDVVIYEEVEGDWQRAPTDPTGAVEGATQFDADTTADGQLVVAIEESPIRATELSLDQERIDAGETVEVTATVENTGDVTETNQVSLLVFGESVDTQEVTLEPGEEETLTFIQRIDSPGSHTVEVAGETQQLDVEGDEPAGGLVTQDESSGYLAIAAGSLVAVLLLVWWQRSPEE